MSTLYLTSGSPVGVYRTDGTLVWGGTPTPGPDPEPDTFEVPTGPTLNVMASCAATSTGLGFPTNSTDGTTFTTTHTVVVDTEAPVLRWALMPPAAGGSVTKPSVMRAALRIGSSTHPITWGGQEQVTVPVPTTPPTIITSDPVQGVRIPAGSSVDIHVWSLRNPEGSVPGSSTGVVIGSDRGYVVGGPENLTSTAYANGQTVGSLRPAGMLSPSDQPSWLITGDSITWGSNCHAERAMRSLGWASTKAAMGGEGFLHFPSRFAERFTGTIESATHAFCAYGVNDVWQTLEVTRTRALALWKQLRQAGVAHLAQATLSPCFVGSTDGHSTLEAQTPPASYNRLEMNAWLRDGAPLTPDAATPVGTGTTEALRAGQEGHPVQQIIDISAAVEDPTDPRKWRVDKGAIAGDGTHPYGTGHDLMATAILNALTCPHPPGPRHRAGPHPYVTTLEAP